MITETITHIILIIGILGLTILFLIITKHDNTINKIMDKSCYYYKFNKTPYNIRKEHKNTCTIIDNTNWNNEQIRQCKYRIKNP